MDLTPDGETARATEPAILQQVASSYRGIGWPAEAAGVNVDLLLRFASPTDYSLP